MFHGIGISQQISGVQLLPSQGYKVDTPHDLKNFTEDGHPFVLEMMLTKMNNLVAGKNSTHLKMIRQIGSFPQCPYREQN